jgi:tetratricopeptide (TPR) repeat protein
LIIANKFSQAIELYSEAIELNESNAVYWANRAFAHTKLEEYGSAISDATKAIEVDPRYSKVGRLRLIVIYLSTVTYFVRVLASCTIYYNWRCP